MSKLSVIIPTHNRQPMLQQAIESVLRQTCKNIEILIIDDCSSDETKSYLQTLTGICVMTNSAPSDAGRNRQKAYNQCKGDYVVFLDDDDFYTNDRFFETAIRHLQEDPSLVAVTSCANLWYTETDLTQYTRLPFVGKVSAKTYLSEFTLKYAKPWSTFTTVFRKSMLDEADFRQMEMMNDTSIYLRALCVGDIYFLNEISGVYRIHPTNMSKHIRSAFILANLNEKINVYQMTLTKNIGLPDTWLNRQLFTTIKYYLKESSPTYTEIARLILWILQRRGIFGIRLAAKSMYLAIKFKVMRQKHSTFDTI